MFPDSNIAQKFPVGKLSARQFAVIFYLHRWVETALDQHGASNVFLADAYKSYSYLERTLEIKERFLGFLRNGKISLSRHWIFWI